MFRTWSWLCPISPSRRLSRTSRPSPRGQSPSWSWWPAPCRQSRSQSRSPLRSPRTDTRPHIQSSSQNSRVWIINKISFFEVFKYLWIIDSYWTQYCYRVSFGIIARGSGCGTEAITISGAVTSLATPEIDKKGYWWIAVILKWIIYLSGDCWSHRDCCTLPSSW